MQGENTDNTSAAALLIGSSWVFASTVAYALYLMTTDHLNRHFGAMRFTGLAMRIAALGYIVHFAVVTPQPLMHLLQVTPTVWLCGIGLGIFLTALRATLLMLGIGHLGSAQAALLTAIGPILTVVLARLVLGEQLTGLQWLGCFVNIAGVLMITRRKQAG